MVRKSLIAKLSILAFLIFSLSSCKTGEGCQATEHYEAKTDKDGVLSDKKGRSSLFSKKQKKRMKKRRN